MKKSILLLFLFSAVQGYTQSGITWTSAMNIAPSSYGNMHPRIVTDGQGNPVVIWGRMSDKSLFIALWNGSSFNTPVQLNPSWMDIATASWMGPGIASKGDTVYVVMKRSPEASDTCHIYLVSSFNGGQTFSSPSRVDFIADSVSRFPAVTVDDNGNPIVAFMKFNSSFLESRWVVTRSADYGNTFSPDVKASGWSGPTAEVCDCCPGAIINAGNTVAVLYRDNLSNLREIWTGLSTDTGSTFTGGFEVDNTGWMVGVCPASGPDGVIAGDTLYTVFMSSASGAARTYLSKSSVASMSVSSTNMLTGSISGLNTQNFPRITSDGTAAAIVWTQTVAGANQLPLLFTNNLNNGFPSSYDTVDLNYITNADVALAGGKIYIVWQDDNSGSVKFRGGTFTQSGTMINEIEQEGFSVYPNPVYETINMYINPAWKKEVMGHLFSSDGRMIRSFIVDSGEKNIRLNVDDLSKGVYAIRIIEDKNIFTKTIIIQ